MSEPADIHAVRAAVEAVAALARQHGCTVQISFHVRGEMPVPFAHLPRTDEIVTCHGGARHNAHSSVRLTDDAIVIAGHDIDDEDPRVVDLCHEHDQACHRWTRRRGAK